MPRHHSGQLGGPGSGEGVLSGRKIDQVQNPGRQGSRPHRRTDRTREGLTIEGAVAVSRLELLEMLKRDNITVLTNSQLIEIGKRKVKNLRNGSPSLMDADAVILALSMRPRKEIFDQLAHLVPISLAVGDCVTPGKIGDTIHDAANKVFNLGESPSW